MMTLSNRPNRDNQYTQHQLTVSASVRKLWGVLEQWYVGQKETIDKQRSKALRDLDRKTFSKKDRESRKSKLHEEHDTQLGDIARTEWDRRLTAAGLRADEWVDLTVNEAWKIERTLGGPLAHLSEKEYVAQMAAQSSTIPPPQPSSQPFTTTQSTLSPPISASSSIQSTYEFFNPSGYDEADDEREAGSSLPTLGLNGYVTSDEDADVDTKAFMAWKSGDSRKSASPPTRHTNIATTEVKPHPSTTTKKANTQPALMNSHQSTSPSFAAPSPRHSPPSFAAPKPQPARRDEELALFNIGERVASEEALRKEEEERRYHQPWLIDKPHSSSLASTPPTTFENSASLHRVPSNESDHRSLVPAYIGPHQQIDTSDTEIEEEDFERFKMVVREDKIHEFHKEAAEADVHLARDINNLRKHWSSKGSTREQEATKIAEHEARMLQLRQRKESERKQIVSAEREKRRAGWKKRISEPPRRGSDPHIPLVSATPSHPAHLPTASSPPAITPTAPVPSRHARRVTTSTPIPSRIRHEAASMTPKPAQRVSAREHSIPKKSDSHALDDFPPDVAQRFADSQRRAQVVHADNGLDPDVARRFQQTQQTQRTQRLAQSSISRESSEAPHFAPPVDTKSKGSRSSAPPPSETSAPSRSSSRMTSSTGWIPSPSAFADRLGWGPVETESSFGGTRGLHRPSPSPHAVTMEEVEDDDASPWIKTNVTFDASRHQGVATSPPGSSIQRLQFQSESPLLMEMEENGARPIERTSSNDVVAISSFNDDDEDTSPNPPGAWDFNNDPDNMESPAFWDKLLSGDAPSRPPHESSLSSYDSVGGNMYSTSPGDSFSNRFTPYDEMGSSMDIEPFMAASPSMVSPRYAASSSTAPVKKAAPPPSLSTIPNASPLTSHAVHGSNSAFTSPPPLPPATKAAAPPPSISKTAKKGKGGKRR